MRLEALVSGIDDRAVFGAMQVLGGLNQIRSLVKKPPLRVGRAPGTDHPEPHRWNTSKVLAAENHDMSLMEMILGHRSVAEAEAEADKAVLEEEFGAAKLHLERALELVPVDEIAEQNRLRGRVDAMRDRIAESRILAADLLLAKGDDHGSMVEAVGAIDIAASEDVVAAARKMKTRIEMRESVQVDEKALSDKRRDRLAAITGAWTEPQTEEYDAYGDEILDASVALAEGHLARARDLFERILRTAARPAWIYLDVARARWAASDLAGADSAFTSFLDSVTDEDGAEARAAASVERARLREVIASSVR